MTNSAADNGRFCEMATVIPQTILYRFELLSPAGSLVEAATSQSRWDVIRHVGTARTTLKQNFLTPERTREILKIEKILKLNSLPSLLYRVHFVHTIKQTPRKKSSKWKIASVSP